MWIIVYRYQPEIAERTHPGAWGPASLEQLGENRRVVIMRFAFVTTSVAAALAVPLALAAAGPQMSRDEFLSAVRCTAFEDVNSAKSDLGLAKWRLNSEASRQGPDAAAAAQAEVDAVARAAVNGESAPIAASCANGRLADGAAASPNV